MNTPQDCQLPGLPRMSEGQESAPSQSPWKHLKRSLAVPWNYQVKPFLKRLYRGWRKRQEQNNPTPSTPVAPPLAAGDWVRVRPLTEIQATLDPWKELRGCAFLPYMAAFCGSTQQVLQPVERFLDERDYKVKKSRGVVLLAGVLCQGTPVFGRCDRACHLFWREEWLEKIAPPN